MRQRPTVSRSAVLAAYQFVDRYEVKKEVQDALIRNGITMEDALGCRRFSEICRARAIIFQLLYQKGCPIAAIARTFNKHRDSVELYLFGKSRKRPRAAGDIGGGEACR